ncbi:hypothetical protein K2173_024280 [Erythroxylum novogranatense]|uniref:Uncharacterized protein n=1 Tax=Erythroxylum novogranatense TaxID=1862640 RepID=A0AAV8STW5_9ROSI|nr:hypothetical protein K2173_024280 [Erythroxylum novogranatense]
MRGTKDEEKMLSPMFPRLHVNDTEKGGPKAPPRNKMALYEQLSIPSQKLSSGSPCMLPLHPNNGNNLVPSMSTSHGCAYERSAFIPFCNSPANSHVAEKLFSYCSGGGNINGDMASQNKKSVNGTNDQSVNITGKNDQSVNITGTIDQSVSITLTSGTTPKFNLFQSPAFSNLKSVSCNEPGDEKDLRVPTQSVAALTCSKSWHQINLENLPHLNLSFSMPLQNVSDRHKKGTEITVLKEKDYLKNQNQDNAKESRIPDSLERSAPVPSVKGKTVANTLSMADTLSIPSSRVSLKETHSSSDREYRSIAAAGVLKSLNGISSRINQESVTTQEKTILRDMECTGSRGKENASKLQGEPYSRHSFGDDKRSPNEVQNVIESSEERKHGSSQIGHAERCDDVSETSMVDSIVAFTITPDDVVGVIGEKQFWKARRAIINQQRVFSIQVFELHRLIKVQKTIAGSPHLLHEDSLHVGKASLKSSPVKKLPSEYAIEPTPEIVKPKEQSHKPRSNTEFADENAVGGPPLPSANLELNKPVLAPRSNYEPHSGSLPVPMAATNTKPTPWCFPAPGNQWLVPVMSPSEGLVYKPYSGPSPPTPGFMTPVYGSCGPMSLTPGNGDFLNATYGVPASTPPLGQTYFPPYGMPILNQSISGSSMEQMSPFTGPQSKDNQVSVGNMNLVFPHRSSSNMASQTSRVTPRCGGKFQASKESDVQGSTATSPAERVKGNALPLFPTEPTVQASDQSAQTNKEQTRVIKVVPRNPRTATESAAWIFRSIQEERKYYD